MRFLVFTQDEYNNNYYIGVFNELENAIPKINEWLGGYEVQITELTRYPGTFGYCFDKEIITPNEEYVYVRGFILDDEELKPID